MARKQKAKRQAKKMPEKELSDKELEQASGGAAALAGDRFVAVKKDIVSPRRPGVGPADGVSRPWTVRVRR